MVQFYHQLGFEVQVNAVTLKRCIEMIVICQTNASLIESDQVPVASAIFTRLSLMNHSCTSNVFMFGSTFYTLLAFFCAF